MLSTILFVILSLVLAGTTLYYKNLAEKDALTGVYNKWWFMLRRNSKLVRMMKAARKDMRKSFSIINIDMNKFKEYNDTKGHPAGDRLIVDTVSSIQRTIRGGDFVVRVGGDEFIVVVKGIHHKAGLDRRIKQIKEWVLEDTGRTISTGGVVYTHDMPDINVDLILKMADDDMYKDKKRGE